MTPVALRSLRRLPVAALLLSSLLVGIVAHAQHRDAAAHTAYRGAEEETWSELEVKPPARFSTDSLQGFDVSINSALSYGIDPATLTVGADGVVRYVLVARSSSGALNALYQGVRCETAEYKTYGRWDNQSSWNTSNTVEWLPLSFSGASRPAMMLARAGICEGRTVTGDAQKILTALKKGPTARLH